MREVKARLGQMLGWLRNPWAQPRWLWVAAIAYVAWILFPVVIAMVFSFNSGRSISVWQGFSLRWYLSDENSVLSDPDLRGALVNSLRLAGLTVLISVPLGVGLALGLDRWRRPVARGTNFLAMFAFITPELAIAAALFLYFTRLATFVSLGLTAQVLGLSMFEIAYTLIVVRARLGSLGRDYEDAAMDLGASPRQAVRRVLLPMLAPAIMASAAIVFAASLDNFVISQQLNLNASTQTVPILIYSSARTGPLPSLNALAAITVVLSTGLIGLGAWIYRRAGSPRGAASGPVGASQPVPNVPAERR